MIAGSAPASDFDALANALKSSVRGRVERSYPLARLTTYKLGGPAAVLFEPADDHDLSTAASIVAEASEEPAQVPVLALGRGSNTVVSDLGWPGLVIRLTGGFSRIASDRDDARACIAEASVTLPLLANWLARRGLSGVEWGVGVPGSVGGAVRMNAGAHGTELADSLVSAAVLDFTSGITRERDRDSLELGYRRSALAASDIVLRARLRLTPENERDIRARMESYRKHRAATQPGALQNAGSTFKNPPDDAAGRIVEAAGLKGFRVGGARVSELHANFFMAEDGATAQDVYDLVHEVKARVHAAFGITLEPEVRFAGRFDATADRGAGVIAR